jgi:AraC family transcriptional regulator
MPPRDGTEAIAAGSTTGPVTRRRPAAATNVLAGAMPDPLLSSRARGWKGITVELHRFSNLDAVVQAPDHVIAVHLSGAVTVHREHAGRTRSRAMRPGDVTITPVGPPIRWRQVGQSLVLLIRLSPEHIRTMAGDECAIDPNRFEIQPVFSVRDPQIEDLGQRLLAGLEFEGADSHLHADTLACELTIRLLRDYTTVPASPVWAKAKLSPHKLRRALQFIDENLRNDLTLAAIADAVALSAGHFAHAFRETTGVTPHRYIVERRVERARHLLHNSDLPLAAIAEMIGCASQSHFSVVFHRVTGLTPRQFRTSGDARAI